MRPLAIFLAGVLIAFGVIATIIVLSRSSERAFVVVDTSFPMRSVWAQVPGALAALEDEGYAALALATDKGLQHSWQPSLELRVPTPYAPCSFEGIETHPEAGDADVRVLITTDGSCPTEGLAGWRIIRLEP